MFKSHTIQIKQNLNDCFVPIGEQGILPKPATEADVGDGAGNAEMKAAEVAPRLADGGGAYAGHRSSHGCRYDHGESPLQIKEAETRNKQLEVQAMHLHLLPCIPFWPQLCFCSCFRY